MLRKQKNENTEQKEMKLITVALQAELQSTGRFLTARFMQNPKFVG